MAVGQGRERPRRCVSQGQAWALAPRLQIGAFQSDVDTGAWVSMCRTSENLMLQNGVERCPQAVPKQESGCGRVDAGGRSSELNTSLRGARGDGKLTDTGI